LGKIEQTAYLQELVKNVNELSNVFSHLKNQRSNLYSFFFFKKKFNSNFFFKKKTRKRRLKDKRMKVSISHK